MRVCPSCRLYIALAGDCSQCRRRACYGVLVAFTVRATMAPAPGVTTEDDIRAYHAALDAVANLLTIGAKERAAHRRELNEAARDAGRDASAAYAEGKQDARDQSDGFY